MSTNLLSPLITSKTRLKLLLRFFMSQGSSGYLQGLSRELDENTNSIRLELNRLEDAGMLSSERNGRRKLYSVNTTHPLSLDLINMIRKFTGIDALVERVTARVADQIHQVWICGALARGEESDTLEVILVGKDFDTLYLKELMEKTEKALSKTINYRLESELLESQQQGCLMVWEKIEA